jgi:formylmethanofuran dehydrogenase subunit B
LQTGFPFAVNFARGYPRSGTQWSAPQMLARGQVDALLLVGADPTAHWPESLTARLATIPTIAITSEPTETTHDATISIRTAPYSLSGSGTIHRLDDIAIPLRPALPSPYPADVVMLQSLLTALDGN